MVRLGIVGSLFLGSCVFGAIAAYPAHIYFMWRWTTAYNLEHFGFANQGKWKANERERGRAP